MARFTGLKSGLWLGLGLFLLSHFIQVFTILTASSAATSAQANDIQPHRLIMNDWFATYLS